MASSRPNPPQLWESLQNGFKNFTKLSRTPKKTSSVPSMNLKIMKEAPSFSRQKSEKQSATRLSQEGMKSRRESRKSTRSALKFKAYSRPRSLQLTQPNYTWAMIKSQWECFQSQSKKPSQLTSSKNLTSFFISCFKYHAKLMSPNSALNKTLIKQISKGNLTSLTWSQWKYLIFWDVSASQIKKKLSGSWTT